MPTPEKSHALARFIFVAAAIVFIIWGIAQTQTVLASFLASLFLSILATPPLLWLQRKRVPVVVAVMLVVAVLVAILAGIGILVGTSINSFSATLPQYQGRIQEQIAAFGSFLLSKNITPPDKLLLQYINPGAIMDLTVSLFAKLGSLFSNILLIVITVIFILLEATSFPKKLRAVLGDPHQAFPQFTEFFDDMKRYMIIKTLLSLATGILVTVLLFIIGVDFPVLWGFLAFLLNYVPSIGSTIAGVPAVLLTLVQFGIGRAVIVTAGYVVINFALDYGVEKRLMGRKLGLSTLVVFLSLLFWGSLLGPVGAVRNYPVNKAGGTISVQLKLD